MTFETHTEGVTHAEDLANEQIQKLGMEKLLLESRSLLAASGEDPGGDQRSRIRPRVR